jgi:protoporphyrinogen oxidase
VIADKEQTTDDEQTTVCVIGAGVSGLSAAYDLGRLGYRVVVLESAEYIGGLASSLVIDGRPIERFYHFICRGDVDLIALVEELGLGDKLHWEQTKTSFYYNGRLYGFGTPIDLLRFTAVPFTQRVRFGLNIISSRFARPWDRLDGLAAKSWLIDQVGDKAYEVIWDPLLRVKFGDYHDQVSAAWIWHRIHRVARSRRRLWERENFGYLELGSETIIQGLLREIERLPNVSLRVRARVKTIQAEHGRVAAVILLDGDERIACDDVISTVALPVLLRLAPDLNSDYRAKLGQIDYLGVVCGLLKLSHPITDSFWVNINDPDIPFNGIIEYSNLNRHLGLPGKAIVYIPYYLRTSAPRFSFGDDQLMDEFIQGLKRINPAFDPSWVEEWHISRTGYAQAICSVGFAALVPDHQTPLDGLYITDSTQFYPEDRTISSAIRVGRRVADMIRQKRTAKAR